jgi:predicted kinase
MDEVHERLARHMWLIAFKGEAGSGKSTLSRALSRRLRWPVIDKDDIRDLLDDRTPGLSYDIMFNVARRQLLQGLSVICDSPLRDLGAAHAAQIAAETGARLAIIECTCPDETAWRDRINSRKAMNLPAHHQTDWEAMQAHKTARAASAHHTDLSTSRHTVVLTVGLVDSLCEQVIDWLVTQADL